MRIFGIPWVDARRASAESWRKWHLSQAKALAQAAHAATQANDLVHASELEKRRDEQVGAAKTVERLIREYDAGVSVCFPGESDW